MTTIVWPTDTPDTIDAIRNAIGRDIIIYRSVQGVPCTASGCDLDPVTQLSTNQFCPVCSGFYYINTTSGLTVNAHVRMKEADVPVWTIGGYIVDGDAQVQIKYNDANIAAVNNSDYFLVDNREFIKKDIDLRGVPTVNRIIVTLVEREGE